MNKRMIAIAAGVAGLAYLLFNRARKDVFGLNYSIVGVSGIDLLNMTVSLQVKITNPTITPFPLYKTTVTGNVSVNNSMVLGTATGYADQLLSPGSAVIVPVSVRVNPAVFNANLGDLVSVLSASGVLFSFSGKITVGGVESPLNMSYKVL